MEKIFCIHCDKENEYYTKEVTKIVMVRGVSCEVKIKECYCCGCNSSVFVYLIEKENQRIIFDVYKKKMGLMTAQEIIDLRKKYGLSQKRLAQLIYCGEKNIARYENGAIQDKSINLLLKMVDLNPEYFGLKNKKESTRICLYIGDIKTKYKEDNSIKYQAPKKSNNYSIEGGKLLPC